MRRAIVVVMALVGCYRHVGETACAVSCETDTDCPSGVTCENGLCGACTIDAAGYGRDGSDAPADGDDTLCYGHLGITLCAATANQGSASLDPGFDTSNTCPSIRIIAGQTVCVVSGTDVVVNQPTRITGGIPLVLFATHSIEIGAGGSLDVSSYAGQLMTGAAADTAVCPVINAVGGGAGAGGSFRASPEIGGDGGAGGNTSASEPGATAQQGAGNVTQVTGGCAGGTGGNASGGAGLGGHSGGAVYLLAGGSIQIYGFINASGAGGQGGSSASTLAGGAGGGGSGGLIVLDAPMVQVTSIPSAASLYAEGGGGGGGGVGAPGGLQGGAGGDPDRTKPDIRATGGQPADANSGKGGDGSILDTAGLIGASFVGFALKYNGGGGGGGGPGHIYTYGTYTEIGTVLAWPTPENH